MNGLGLERELEYEIREDRGACSGVMRNEL
jgi:hypothetical protein